MTKRKDFGTLMLWGLARKDYEPQRGVYRRRAEAQWKADALNKALNLHFYEPVRVTLSWERPARKRRDGESLP